MILLMVSSISLMNGCQILCGNGTLEAAFEECDDGNQFDGDGCSAVCTIEECGNDILDSGEECDDGGNQNCDGCSAACLEEFCGDGITCASQGEECDDGNNDDGDGCTNNCQLELAFCGNGNVDPGEECDDGGNLNCDGCSSGCQNEFCGDGITCASQGEECDDGNNDDGDGCSATCQVEGDFDILLWDVTPFLQFGPTGFPRFDGKMEIEIVAQTSTDMSEMQIEVMGCVEPDVSDCTPVVESTPSTTQWSLRTPGLTGAIGGRTYTLKVTATAPTSQTAEATVDVIVHPFDPTIEITCTKRNDPVDGFEVDFDVLQNGQPLVNILNQKLWLYEDKDDGEGFAFDETDSFRSAGFALIYPITFSPGADGIYQVVFSGTDFSLNQGFQASLYFTDDGGPDDVCVWE